MNHLSTDELKGFLNDTVDVGRSSQITEHLDSCPDCCLQIERIISEREGILRPLQNRSRDSTVPQDDSRSIQVPHRSKTEFELRFLLLEEIARGGMGIVYRGFDREFKREVAIKVALKKQAALSIRLSREAKISGQLQHPGVVPVYELGQVADGRFCMAMRLVRGKTLLSLLQDEKDKQTLAANLEIFGQICQTIAYAHSEDFVHRDLKPQNVMVGSFGEVQIMDWGLAKHVTENDTDWSQVDASPVGSPETIGSIDAPRGPNLTLPGQVMGTPAYMAPEQAQGEATTKRTDVFALGGILFQILTEKAPFDETTHTRAMAKSASASLSDAFATLDQSEADPTLIDIVKACLSPDPMQRPHDAEEVNRRFSQYIADREQERQDSKLAEARVKERLVAQQKRNRQLAWSAGAIVAALAISAAAGFMYLQEKNSRIANQSKVQRERIEKTVRDEQKIREILKATAEHERLAMELEPVRQAQQWILAKKEIEKTGAILSDHVDPELLETCNATSERVLNATEQSIQVRTNHEAELACLQGIRSCSEESFYTDPIKQAIDREQSITSKLAAIYRRIGVSSDADLGAAVKRIANSNLKTELMLGLMVWQRELDGLSSEGTPTGDANSDWLNRLIMASDPDSFRTRLRSFQSEQNVSEVAKLMESNEAVVSRLNIYTVVSQFSQLSVEKDSQLAFLRRAKDKFPEDFLTNWFHATSVPTTDPRRNECALTCCTLRPGNLAAMWMLGETCVEQANYPQAVDTLEKLVSDVPRFAAGHVQLAIALGQSGKTKSAFEHFDVALELKPKLSSVFRHRGELHFQEKQFDAAADDLLKYRQLQPHNSDVDELMFKNYEQGGRTEKAIESLNRIIKENPKIEENYEKLWLLYQGLMARNTKAGLNHTAKQTIIDAVANYVELTELFPDLHSPYETLARHYEHQSDFYDAIKSLKKAIERLPATAPKSGELTKLMADLARRVYDFSIPESERNDVISMLKEVSSFIETRSPDFEGLPELYVVLGRLYQQNDQLEEAIEATETAYAIQQQTPYDAYHVEMITTGIPAVNKALESLGLPSAVIKKRTEVRSDKAKLRMHNPKAISSLAMLLMQQGSLEKSEAIVRKALTHTPDVPLLKLVLAKSLAMQIAKKPDDQKRAEILKLLRQLEFSDNPLQLSR